MSTETDKALDEALAMLLRKEAARGGETRAAVVRTVNAVAELGVRDGFKPRQIDALMQRVFVVAATVFPGGR